MNPDNQNLKIGLGLRRDFMAEVAHGTKLAPVEWFEVAPENYIERGGYWFELFEKIADQYPLAGHGLSLSIGSLDPLNFDLLKKIKKFIRNYKLGWMSDHLCFSSYNQTYFHELLPLPLTQEAINHCAKRIQIIQDFLEVPFGVENISYYYSDPQNEMTEWQFVTEIIEKSKAQLLLDVNNVYVNSQNHGFDPKVYLDALNGLPVLQIHIAGHDTQSYPDLIIDNHGADIIDPVWDLLGYFARQRKLPPILIERDHQIPDLDFLLQEAKIAAEIYHQFSNKSFSD